MTSTKVHTIQKHHKSKHCSLNPTHSPSSERKLLVMKYEVDRKRKILDRKIMKAEFSSYILSESILCHSTVV